MQMKRRASTQIPFPIEFFGSNERRAQRLIATREFQSVRERRQILQSAKLNQIQTETMTLASVYYCRYSD